MAFDPKGTTPLPVAAPSLGVRFPGGLRMSAQLATTNPSSRLENAAVLLARSTAGLGPLGSVFTIIEAVLSIKKFADAVPELLVNPGAVVEAVVEVAKKVGKLASLIPQLSFPIMLLDLVNAMVTLFEGLQEEYVALVDANARIAEAEALLPTVPGLGPSIDQAKSDVDTQSANLGAILNEVDAIAGVINALAEPLGLPTIPSSGSLPSDPGEAIEAIDPILKVLRGILTAIPV